MKTDINFPFGFNERGRTAETGTDKHIRDMIEQVLFTAPGERVNRPTFGCGLRQLVFQPNSEELATATQFLVQGALQQWLGDLIQVDEVRVESNDSSLEVTIVYTVLRTGESRKAQFQRGN
ncbi:MAG: GPW/gp25 family protein [Candidatus Aminicenantes bacterium]|jgi:phage baseplate assembly protein W